MDFINVNVFRAKMKGFFDEADSGKDVTISRSKGRFYKLVPYSADSLVMDGLRRLAMHTILSHGISPKSQTTTTVSTGLPMMLNHYSSRQSSS